MQSAKAEFFVNQTAHLDRILPSMMTPNVKNSILRIFVYHYESDVIRIYPGHDISEDFARIIHSKDNNQKGEGFK